jgi:hypothetical protein
MSSWRGKRRETRETNIRNRPTQKQIALREWDLTVSERHIYCNDAGSGFVFCRYRVRINYSNKHPEINMPQ